MTTLKLLFSQKILKLAAVSLSAKDSRVLQELRFPVLRFRCHIPPPKLFWKFSRLRRFGHFGTCSILSCRRKWHKFCTQLFNTFCPLARFHVPTTFSSREFIWIYAHLPKCSQDPKNIEALNVRPWIPECPTLFTSHGSCI